MIKTLADYKGQAVQLRTERDKVKTDPWLRMEFELALEFVRRKVVAIESKVLAGRMVEVVVLVCVVRLCMVCS